MMNESLVNHALKRIAVLIAMLLLLSTNSTVSAQAENSNNWIKYINDFDGYHILYPSSWSLHASKEMGSAADIIVNEATTSGSQLGLTRLNIIAFRNESRLPVPQWYEQFVSKSNESVDMININNIKFFKYIEDVSEFIYLGTIRNVNSYYVASGNRIYRIYLMYEEHDNTSKDMLQAILRTIKFDSSPPEPRHLSLPISPNQLFVVNSRGTRAGQHIDKESPVPLQAPWTQGVSYILSGSYYGEGMHTDYYNDFYSTDWNRVGTSGDGDKGDPVLAVQTGIVDSIRTYDGGLGSGGKWVRIKLSLNPNIFVTVLHLDQVMTSLNTEIHTLPYTIGTVGDSGLGTDGSAHIHLSVRENINGILYSIKPGNLSDQPIVDNGVIVSKNGQSSSSCTNYSYNGVVLFDHSNCNTSGDKREYSSTGYRNIGDFPNRTSSIHIKPGWSAKVWDRTDYGTPEKCISSTIDNLSQHTWSNGQSMNDTIEAIAVFDNSTCSSGGGTTINWNVGYYEGHDRWEPASGGVLKCTGSFTSTSLSKDWGDTAPCGGMNADNWVADITGTYNFPTGAYYFHAQHDDGLRIWANGNEIYRENPSHNQWNCTPRNLSGTVNMRALLREDGGQAKLDIYWQTTKPSECQQPTPPAMPTNLRIAGKTQTSMTIAWDDVAGENGYYVYKWWDGAWIKLGQTASNVTTYTETGLTCSTASSGDHIYTIAAFNNDGESGQPSYVFGKTESCGEVPAAPTLLTPAANTIFNRGDSISLSWNASTGATHYFAEVAGPVNQNSGWIDGRTATIGEKPGGVYQWQVKARNAAGDSVWSEKRTFSIRYAPPLNFAASVASATRVNFTWTASLDVSYLQDYKLYRDGVFIDVVGSATTTSYSDLSVTCGKTYTYYLIAYREMLDSLPSNTATVSTPACASAPSVPANLRVAGKTQTSMTIAWDDVAGETGYYVYKWWDGAWIKLGQTAANVTTYTETGLTCSTASSGDHIYIASAFNNVGESNWPSYVFGKTESCGEAPSAPTLLTPAANTIFNRGDSISLSWNASTGATHYFADVTGPVNQNSGWIDGRTAAIGEKPGGVYQWQVKARNAAGESVWSEKRTFSIRYAPPLNFAASVASATRVNFTWTASPDSSYIQDYKLYRDGVFIAVVGSSVATSYSDLSVTCGKTYTYSLTAYRDTLESLPSNTSTVSTPACASVPNVPANLRVTAKTQTSMTIAWNDVAGENGYYVYKWWNGAWIKIGQTAANVTTYTETGLTCSTTSSGDHIYTVAAFNNVGESGRPQYTSQKTEPCGVVPRAPSDVKLQGATKNSISISWTASADAANIDGYRIYRDTSPIATVSRTETSYTDSGLMCGFFYGYSVTAFKGSLESAQSNMPNFNTIPCFVTESEIVKNGGFENGFVPWAVVRRSNDWRVCNKSAQPAYSGSCTFIFRSSPRENSNINQMYIANPDDLVAGDRLRLSAYVRSYNVTLNRARLVALIYYTDQPIQRMRISIPTHTKGVYNYVFTELQLTGDVEAISIRVINTSSTGFFLIDNISLINHQSGLRNSAIDDPTIGTQDDLLPLPPTP